MKLFHICNPENRRAHFFKEACDRLGLPEPTEVPWLEFLSGRLSLSASPEDIVRVESPGENFEVERLLIERGGGRQGLVFDQGRIRYQRQWFSGWEKALREIERECENAFFINHPGEIALMFDKYAAQQTLEKRGVPIPQLLGTVESFGGLVERMAELQVRQVFLKPRHSSSASGVIALKRSSRGHMIAVTSAELSTDESGIYNSLKLRKYSDSASIRKLVDALVRENLMVERWFPKASIGGKVFDLRVLVIGGEAGHVVARTSRSPITNLHLGNERGDISAIRDRLGETLWREGMAICENAAMGFPGCHYIAVDLLIGSGFKTFAVAEVNAFGDLIPNVILNGDDTYTAELRSFFQLGSHGK